jgi:hypothetical protein
MARQAAVAMYGACVAARDDLSRLYRRINDIERHLSSGGEARSLNARTADLSNEALGVAESWCEPWIDQLEHLERMIEDAIRRDLAATQPGEERERLETLHRQARSLRGEVDRRLRDGSDLDDLRSRFSDLAREALTWRDRATG